MTPCYVSFDSHTGYLLCVACVFRISMFSDEERGNKTCHNTFIKEDFLHVNRRFKIIILISLTRVSGRGVQQSNRQCVQKFRFTERRRGRPHVGEQARIRLHLVGTFEDRRRWRPNQLQFTTDVVVPLH